MLSYAHDFRDKELRFTVYDSLDYHKVKVSVFNEDRRTDLIGETIIDLDSILKPGGGQSDVWHTLHCKGKYAGEIRLELTYYDTRPRENTTPEPKRNTSASTTPLSDRSPDVVGGPRAPRQLKRRPLPSEPIQQESTTQPRNHTQSSPQPYTPPRDGQPTYGSSPIPDQFPRTPQRGQEFHQPSFYEQESNGAYTNQPNQASYEGIPEMDAASELEVLQSELPGPRMPPHAHHEPYMNPNLGYEGPTNGTNGRESDFSQPPVYHYQGVELPELPPHTPRSNRSSAQASPLYFSPANSSPVYTLPQYDNPEHPEPLIDTPEDTRAHNRLSSSPQRMRTDGYQGSPLRNGSFHEDDEPKYNRQIEAAEDEGPPPPPAHRSSGIGAPPEDDPRYQHTAMPAPLNIKRSIGNFLPATPENAHSVAAPPARYSEPNNSRAAIPPALEAGRLPEYQQSPVPQPRPRGLTQNAYGAPRSWEAPSQPPQNRHPQPYENRKSFHGIGGSPHHNHAPNRASQIYQPGPPYHGSPAQGNPAFNSYESSPSQFSDAPHTHRSSVPIVRPHAISPASSRKSVSPHPPSSNLNTPPSLPGVPFSPDSYDQLNPNLHTNTSINSRAPRYDSPEGIAEAARDRAKEEKLATDGPIVDSHGRVVDPSDHLPADTWAPEPERKVPRKTHEVRLKFRGSASASAVPSARSEAGGAASLPPPPARPGIVPAPAMPHSADDVSPTMAAGRNRLQKRHQPPRPAPVAHAGAFHSSPAIPLRSEDYTPPHYPLREHANGYGYNSSPLHPRSSPGGMAGPPPVPAKVPLTGGQEQWGLAGSLSEEMSRIDIGMGSGRRGGGRPMFRDI